MAIGEPKDEPTRHQVDWYIGLKFLEINVDPLLRIRIRDPVLFWLERFFSATPIKAIFFRAYFHNIFLG
jgi:hypothetical protein